MALTREHLRMWMQCHMGGTSLVESLVEGVGTLQEAYEAAPAGHLSWLFSVLCNTTGDYDFRVDHQGVTAHGIRQLHPWSKVAPVIEEILSIFDDEGVGSWTWNESKGAYTQRVGTTDVILTIRPALKYEDDHNHRWIGGVYLFANWVPIYSEVGADFRKVQLKLREWVHDLGKQIVAAT